MGNPTICGDKINAATVELVFPENESPTELSQTPPKCRRLPFIELLSIAKNSTLENQENVKNCQHKKWKKKVGQATAFRRFRRPEKNWRVNPKGDRRRIELAPDDSN